MITNWLTSTKFPFYLELGWLLLTFLLWSILCVKYYKTYPLLIIWWNHFHVLDCPYTLTVSYKLARTSGYLHLPGFYPHILPPSVSHSLCFTYTLITSSQDTLGIWILIKAFCKCFMILQCRNLKGILSEPWPRIINCQMCMDYGKSYDAGKWKLQHYKFYEIHELKLCV